MSLANMTCPECGAHLDEEENLSHDGYMGSPHAHNGRGSYGLARHHYYFTCECGWSERPEISKAKRRAALRRERSAPYDWNGVVLPSSATSIEDCVVLSCRSRQTKSEILAGILAGEDCGRGTGHSLMSSYTYRIVTKDVFRQAQTLLQTINFRGCRYSWEFERILSREAVREAVYNCDDH